MSGEPGITTLNPAAIDWTRLIVQVGGWAIVGYAFLTEMPKIRQAHEAVTAAMIANTATMQSLKEVNTELIRELRSGAAHKAKGV